MRNVLFCFPLLSSVILSNAQTATNAVVDANFWSLVSLVESSTAYREVTPDGWKMKYTTALENDFYSDFPSNVVVEVISSTYISVTNQADYNTPAYRGQCTQLIKVVTSALQSPLGTAIATDNWKQGTKFNASTPPAIGTVMATFTNGKYNHIHTFIYWGKGTDGKHSVIDQNWVGTKLIAKHKFTDTQMANYYIVQY